MFVRRAWPVTEEKLKASLVYTPATTAFASALVSQNKCYVLVKSWAHEQPSQEGIYLPYDSRQQPPTPACAALPADITLRNQTYTFPGLAAWVVLAGFLDGLLWAQVGQSQASPVYIITIPKDRNARCVNMFRDTLVCVVAKAKLCLGFPSYLLGVHAALSMAASTISHCQASSTWAPFSRLMQMPVIHTGEQIIFTKSQVPHMCTSSLDSSVILMRDNVQY